MECCVEVTATVLARDEGMPLLAIEVTDGKGGLLDLRLVDVEADVPAADA